MTLDEYGARPCVCGRPRSEHAHMKDARGGLRILPTTPGPVCSGYTDAFELQLIATGGQIGPPAVGPARGALLRAHETDCGCISCVHALDVLVPCNHCGADEGEDCIGTEPGSVHLPRRELRIEVGRKKPTFRLLKGGARGGA